MVQCNGTTKTNLDKSALGPEGLNARHDLLCMLLKPLLHRLGVVIDPVRGLRAVENPAFHRLTAAGEIDAVLDRAKLNILVRGMTTSDG